MAELTHFMGKLNIVELQRQWGCDIEVEMTFLNSEVLYTLVERQPTCSPENEQYQDSTRTIEQPWQWSIVDYCGMDVDH